MFTRRQFLASLSLGAAAPLFMPLMRYVSAKDGAEIPKRFVFVVEGNGLNPVNLLSGPARAMLDAIPGNRSVGSARAFSDRYRFDKPQEVQKSKLSTAPGLQALAAAGLEDQAAVVLGLSSSISRGESHSFKYGALGCMRATGSPPAETIDHALSTLETIRGVSEKQGGRGKSPFAAFRGGIHKNMTAQARSGLCSYGANRPAPLIVDPNAAYSFLFSSFVPGEPRRQFLARNDMLDYARRSTERALKTFSGSSPERAKLEQYLASIVDLENQQGILESPQWATRVDPYLQPSDPLWNNRPSFTTSKPFERLALHFDMATAALLGGLTNVSVLGSGFGGGFDITYETFNVRDTEINSRHAICHSAYSSDLGGFTTDNPYGKYLTAISSRHVEMIARMAKRLAETKEPDGSSMLDHTLIVYMSDNGARHHGSGEEWPMLLVGGSKMGFKTDGRTIIYPRHGREGYRQVSNLFNSLGHAAGGASVRHHKEKSKSKFDLFGQESVKMEPFNTKQRQAEGPLSEVWSAV